MATSTTKYTSLITSEHAQQPNFVATVKTDVQGDADNQAVLATFPAIFDLDTAVGEQLDTLGLLVGALRTINIPVTGVYFSFDTTGVGFDQGAWFGPDSPTGGLVVLPDAPYRSFIKAKIAANHWDGTIPDAYRIWDLLFPLIGILIQDNGNMTIDIAFTSLPTDAVTLALMTGGYLSLKPATVGINSYIFPTVPSTPFFGFDLENSAISGFDVGAWGTTTPTLA